MSSSETQSLISLSLTNVEFDSSDPIAYAFAYITLSPLVILVVYPTIIVARREVASINMFIGQFSCEILNAVLKRWLKEKRPTDKLGDGYGMPSSHAQFIAYFTTFSILYLYIRITFDQNLWKFPIAFSLIILSITVSYSRIYLDYHTSKQVLVGNIFGVGFALIWFIITESILRSFGVFKLIVESPLAKFFYLRDSSYVPNIIKVEYMNWVALSSKQKKT
ncbi:4757_t:CDS:2 [Cetraspora pellucida]|uniref:Dolichyldiphosphatase n=1 Tax=Cetraspora pellucida TaxID=1433469 RepID=A0A9N9HMC0_9GLOM|nr:4757_t:CDS:2 [Cetraspora pellucida]